MGTSPITHSLTSRNTPRPQTHPPPGAGCHHPPSAHPVPPRRADPALAGQTQCSPPAPPPSTPHNTPTPATTYWGRRKDTAPATPSPPAPKNAPFPKHTTGMGAGKGLGDTEPAQTIPFTITTGIAYTRDMHRRCPSQTLAHRIGTCRNPRLLGPGAGKQTEPKAAAQLLLSIRANERECIC